MVRFVRTLLRTYIRVRGGTSFVDLINDGLDAFVEMTREADNHIRQEYNQVQQQIQELEAEAGTLTAKGQRLRQLRSQLEDL